MMNFSLKRYKFSNREGLILQQNHKVAEIAPLPGFSSETLEEAQQELLTCLHENIKPTLPSVRWGLECIQRPLRSVSLPLASLGAKEGFATIKLKLGHLSVSEAISLVCRYSTRASIRLDFNRKWTLLQALEFAKHFQPNDFEYLEEPVQTFEELIQFSHLTQFPIALDESIHCDWSQIPSLKAIVAKPMIVGYIPHVPPPLYLVLSSSYESGIGLLHIAALANPSIPVGLDTIHSDDPFATSIQTDKGVFSWTP